MRLRYEYQHICRSNARQGIAPMDLYAWGRGSLGKVSVIGRGDATLLNYEHININILIGDVTLIRMRQDVHAAGQVFD